MLTRIVSTSTIASFALIVLMIVPANAAPNLTVGTSANYNLSANMSTTQFCNASPLVYNQTACGIPPYQPWSFRDDFNYYNISQLQAAGWTIETITPISYYSIGNSTLTLLNDGRVGAGAGHNVPPGSTDWSASGRIEWIGTSGTVSGLDGSLEVAVQTTGHSYVWIASGFYSQFYFVMDGRNQVSFSNYTKQLNVWHVLQMDMKGGTLYGYYDGRLIGAFTDPDTSPGNTNLVNIQALSSWDTNNKFDWMAANSLPPSQAVPPSPPVPPIQLDGNIGWTVVGLDGKTAVLNISHAVRVFVDNIPIAPVSESGSFEQSIDLATRAESPGTSTALVKSMLPTLASLIARSTSRVNMSTIFPAPLTAKQTFYTFWWVNGPLSNGTPVQILTGYSSVQGDETVSLPGGLGHRSAWTVSSSTTEDVSVTIPQLGTGFNGPLTTSDAKASLSLRFDFDKSSDLLLTTSDSVVTASTSTNIYSPGQILCGTFGQCVTVSTMTRVSHVTTMTVSASLTLASTSLNLDHRSPSGGSQPSILQLLGYAMSPPSLIAITGLIGGTIGSIAVLINRRGSCLAVKTVAGVSAGTLSSQKHRFPLCIM